HSHSAHRYLHSFPTRRSSDLVILHEHTHGLSNRLVGGGVGISAFQTSGMGEGWSDFYGMSLVAPTNADPHATYPEGAYLTYQLRSEEHTSELQSRFDLVCRLL